TPLAVGLSPPAPDGLDPLTIGIRLGGAGRPNRGRVALTVHARRGRLSFRSCPRGIRLAPGCFRDRQGVLLRDAYHLFGPDDVVLQIGDSGLTFQRLTFDLRLALRVVRPLELGGHLPLSLR